MALYKKEFKSYDWLEVTMELKYFTKSFKQFNIKY